MGTGLGSPTSCAGRANEKAVEVLAVQGLEDEVVPEGTLFYSGRARHMGGHEPPWPRRSPPHTPPQHLASPGIRSRPQHLPHHDALQSSPSHYPPQSSPSPEVLPYQRKGGGFLKVSTVGTKILWKGRPSGGLYGFGSRSSEDRVSHGMPSDYI